MEYVGLWQAPGIIPGNVGLRKSGGGNVQKSKGAATPQEQLTAGKLPLALGDGQDEMVLSLPLEVGPQAADLDFLRHARQ